MKLNELFIANKKLEQSYKQRIVRIKAERLVTILEKNARENYKYYQIIVKYHISIYNS